MKYFIRTMLIAFILTNQSASGDTNILKYDINRDGAINNHDLAGLAGEWLQSGLPYTPVTGSFPGPAELRCEQVQRETVTAGQWKTIIDINDGPCLITNFWMASNFPGKNRQTPVRIYFDESNEPDIEGWTGDIFAFGFFEPVNYRGKYVGVTNSTETGEGSGSYGFSGYIKLPMPYASSVRIDIRNTSSSDGQCWMMLERLPIDPSYLYSMGLRPGIHLKTFGYGMDDNKTEYSEVVLFDSNQPTVLAGLFHFFGNSSEFGGGDNYYFLEGDYRIYYGGNSVPSYRSSGCDNFYQSSWYFQEGLFCQTDECMVLKNDLNYTLAASRFFPINQAPAHDDGFKLTWQVGEPNMPEPGDTYTSWLVWYYQ